MSRNSPTGRSLRLPATGLLGSAVTLVLPSEPNSILSGPLPSDAAGNLYIGDLGNGRIRKVSGGNITTIAGSGTTGFAGDNGPALAAQFGQPVRSYNYGIAVDPAGSLYIADVGNHRIRKVSNGIITTVAGGEAVSQSNPAASFPTAVPSRPFSPVRGSPFSAQTSQIILTPPPARFRPSSEHSAIPVSIAGFSGVRYCRSWVDFVPAIGLPRTAICYCGPMRAPSRWRCGAWPITTGCMRDPEQWIRAAPIAMP